MEKTALIVDDSKTARVVLQQMLETHELSVDTAASAEEALTYLNDHRPDIIFMDHQMPGMDGLEAVSTIKNNPATASIPIMMYTAQKGEVYVGQARALGAAGVLPKQIEPVEVSKVLETLHIIGRNVDQRMPAAENDPIMGSESGSYPSLEMFDRDMRVLIQGLFDQQRAVLRRDLFDSQKIIASRVAEEIRPPEIDETDVVPTLVEKDWSGVAQVAAIVLGLIALVFAGLYWQSEQNLLELQQQAATLQSSLTEQQAIESRDTFQVQQQLGEYDQALNATRATALSSIQWAANQSSHYGLSQLPMGDFRLSVLAELTNHLIALDFQGLVLVESHVGDFCMSVSGPDGYAHARPELPALRCDRVGFTPVEAEELGLRQSIAFANFINLADERTNGQIRYEIVSLGNSQPLLDYPAAATAETAASWNEIAASNHRVEVSLHPDER